MAEPAPMDQMLTLEEAERWYGVKRSTLYRYIRRGILPTYRRALDRHVYVRRADLDELRRFQRSKLHVGLTLAAVERARAFQRRVFAGRAVSTPSSELIEEARRERDQGLP